MNQTEKKKKAILEVTSNLLRERLISDISMDEIAQLAQVSKVTIF
ncbi:MAG: TetR/AcrR family transcriptional regulator, partial [Lactococcus garvieae]